MELPFTVVFEPPSQSELRDVLRMRRTWVAALFVVLAIGAAGLAWSAGRAEAVGGGISVPLQLASQPAGAGVWVDGRERGQTPLDLWVDPGAHSVVLKAADVLNTQYAVQVGANGARLDALLWRRQPLVKRLRPSMPGALLSEVRVLATGELALTVVLPTGRGIQAWRLEPRSGALQPILSDATGTRLSTTSDAQQVAFVGYEIGPHQYSGSPSSYGAELPNMIWITPADQPSAGVMGWRAPLTSGEQVADVSWSPTAERLLVVTTQALPGGSTRSRVWFVDAATLQAKPALSLPSDVVPGSAIWSPDGEHVVFLARAGALTALCLLDLQGGFRYLADLDPWAASALPSPPATWSSDSQRLLFVAPHQYPPGVASGWLQPPEPRHALYLADATSPTPALVGETDVDVAAWREDGELVGIGRTASDGALDVRRLTGGSTSERLLEVPVKTGSAGVASTAAWDVARGRLVVATPTSSGAVDFWLVMLGLEAEP